MEARIQFVGFHLKGKDFFFLISNLKFNKKRRGAQP